MLVIDYVCAITWLILLVVKSANDPLITLLAPQVDFPLFVRSVTWMFRKFPAMQEIVKFLVGIPCCDWEWEI